MRIGEYSFEPSDGSLARDGVRSRLDPRIASLLELLAERVGDVVDKDTILERVWGETTVGKDAVPVAVYELRKALGDDAKSPRYIETVPKRGYRLIAAVESAGSVSRSHSSSARAGLAAAAVAVLGIALALLLRPADSSPPESEASVVAVIPFEDRAAADEAYLANGVADMLTTDLASIPGVAVLAHASARDLDPVDASSLEELGVTHVVTGSVNPPRREAAGQRGADAPRRVGVRME